MNTSKSASDQDAHPNPIPTMAFATNPSSQKLRIWSKFNVFWVSLLIIIQLLAVAYATDWAIVTLFHLPFALACVLAAITSAGVVYGAWFAVRAAIRSEAQYAEHI